MIVSLFLFALKVQRECDCVSVCERERDVEALMAGRKVRAGEALPCRTVGLV